MRIFWPKNIRILGKDYKVKYTNNPFKYKKRNGTMSSKNRGMIEYREDRIKIWKRNGKDDTVQTILHEIIHAIESGYNYDLGENAVNDIATGIHTVFKDNPQLLKLLK